MTAHLHYRVFNIPIGATIGIHNKFTESWNACNSAKEWASPQFLRRFISKKVFRTVQFPRRIDVGKAEVKYEDGCLILTAKFYRSELQTCRML